MDCKKTKTLTFPFVILILGKSPNLGKGGVFIESNPLLEWFG